MWLLELEILENEYQEYQKERERAQMGDISLKKKTLTKVSGGVKKTIKKTQSSSVQVEVEEFEIQPKKKK